MLIPEQKLWRAVLEQAYMDAESGCDDGLDILPAEQRRARHFLRADSPQDAAILEIICGCAEVPADRLMVWARRHYPAAA